MNEAAYEAAAKAGHEAYELAAPTFGYETREATRVDWDDLSEPMRYLMVRAYRAGVDAFLAEIDAYTIELTPPWESGRTAAWHVQTIDLIKHGVLVPLKGDK